MYTGTLGRTLTDMYMKIEIKSESTQIKILISQTKILKNQEESKTQTVDAKTNKDQGINY